MPEFTEFLQSIVASQFADIKGSWANLHLELPEKLLNELLKVVTSQKKSEHQQAGDLTTKLLAMIHSAHVKGSISLDVKLNV